MRGIWFDDVHSDDLNLVLSKVSIPPATVRTNFVDIPGTDGSVDLTEALGKVNYKDRECTFTLTILPPDDSEDKKREVSNLVNGKRCKIILDKDPDYYWIGRCGIKEYKAAKNIHQITVKATVAPYKLKRYITEVHVDAGENVSVRLRNGRRAVVPTITTTAATTIVFGDITHELSAGTHKLLDVVLVEGFNQLTVTSSGTVKFSYQEGDL